LRSGKLRVVFNSVPIEFTGQSVMLDAGGAVEALPNDEVFADGVAPNNFLKKIGVEFGSRDVTLEVSRKRERRW